MERIHYIDVAKGIAIFWVVLGHCAGSVLGDHSRLFYTIYAFHMPLWFFISGTLYQYKAPGKYIGGKVKALLLPYLTFSVLNVFSYYILAKLHHAGVHAFVKFGGLWFLLALFYVVITYYVIENSCLRRYGSIVKFAIMSILAFAFLIVGMSMGGVKTEPMHSLATTMVCFFFFHIGVFANSYMNFFSSVNIIKRVTFMICGVFLFLLLTYIAPLNFEPIDVNYGRYGNKLMFISFAMLGIASTILISSSINKNKVLEYFGQNSLLILVLHIPLWRFFDSYAVANGWVNYHRLLFTFICAFALTLLLIVPINKYLPELKGKIKFKESD